MVIELALGFLVGIFVCGMGAMAALWKWSCPRCGWPKEETPDGE